MEYPISDKLSTATDNGLLTALFVFKIMEQSVIKLDEGERK